MRTAREIRKYLKQQHWYKEYKRCVKATCFYTGDLFIRGYKGEVTISSALSWRGSPSGYKAWKHRCLLFHRWYKRGKKRYESKKVSGKTARSQSGSSTD